MAKSRRFLALTVVLAVASGLGLWQLPNLSAWYAVRQLLRASPGEREAQAQVVKSYGRAALPHLLAALAGDEPTCLQAEAGLKLLAPDVSELCRRYQEFSPFGQGAVLRLLAEPQRTLRAEEVRGVMELAEKQPALRSDLLLLAATLAPAERDPVFCRRLILQGLGEADPSGQLSALHLTLQTSDAEILGKVAPLLQAPTPEVRRAALVILSAAPEIAGDDDLLFLLNDVDSRVRQQCELVLRSRGLSDQHLHLARLITHADPNKRSEVVRHLFQTDVNAGEWLRRLSQDSAPSVRVSAARAASQQADAGMQALVREISQGDPSPTVRELASYFLSKKQ